MVKREIDQKFLYYLLNKLRYESPSKILVLQDARADMLTTNQETEDQIKEIISAGYISEMHGISSDIFGPSLSITDLGIKKLRTARTKTTVLTEEIKFGDKNLLKETLEEVQSLKYHLERYQFGRVARENQYKAILIIAVMSAVASIAASTLFQVIMYPTFLYTAQLIWGVCIIISAIGFYMLQRIYDIDYNFISYKSELESFKLIKTNIQTIAETVGGNLGMELMIKPGITADGNYSFIFVKEKTRYGRLFVNNDDMEIMVTTSATKIGKNLIEKLKNELDKNKEKFKLVPKGVNY